MKHPLLSIILPVYNDRDTLRRSVDSVVSQDFTDYELIIVDDGSTDGSGAMCDERAAKDGRIRVVHTANGGLSRARNHGIEAATGQYVTFIDADDRMGAGTLSSLMAVIRAHPEYDIVEYPALVYYQSERETLFSPPERVYRDMDDYWLRGRAYDHAFAWNKVYRLSLFDGTRYRDGVKFEDLWLLPSLLAKARTVATVDRGLYFYYSRAGSITHRIDTDGWRTLLQAHLGPVGRLARTHPRDKHFHIYYMRVVNIQLKLYSLTGELLLPACRVSLTSLRGEGYRTMLKAIMLKLLGLKTLCKTYKTLESSRS